MKYFFRLVLNALALLLVAAIVPGFSVSLFWTALLAALVLGIVNVLIRPLLLLLTLPINLLTLGIFTFVVNALMLSLVAGIVPGFSIDGFGHAIIGAIVLWIISLLAHYLTDGMRRETGVQG